MRRKRECWSQLYRTRLVQWRAVSRSWNARSALNAPKRNLAIRVAMTDLRRDIGKARFLIEGLHRRFPEVAPTAELTGGRLGVGNRELLQRAAGLALYE